MKWKPIAKRLRDQIDAGTLKAGDWPSIGGIQRETGMSRVTIARAFQKLEAEGLLERWPGLGYTVAEPPPPVAAGVRAELVTRRTGEHR